MKRQWILQYQQSIFTDWEALHNHIVRQLQYEMIFRQFTVPYIILLLLYIILYYLLYHIFCCLKMHTIFPSKINLMGQWHDKFCVVLWYVRPKHWSAHCFFICIVCQRAMIFLNSHLLISRNLLGHTHHCGMRHWAY